ncbi:hypothetical protein EDB85DRAFT_2074762 [Lactarius pseudohatsudake]|nr:hypothetical protein EDB85DRAFT_2074762 [Lactarius pseudohatsudake]
MRFKRHPREFFLNIDGLHRQISYAKLPGLLELTTIHLQWTQDRKKAPAVRVAHPEVTLRYKIGLENDSNGHNLAFTSPPLVLTERAQTPTSSPNNAVPAPAPSRPSNPKCCCERRFPHLNTPDLAAPHRELVVSGQVTETEFWEGCEVHLLLAQAASDSQKKSRTGPQAVEDGENKIVIAPQLVHDAFDEYPVAAKAYDETCRAKYPSQRPCASRLFHSHRASIRSTSTQHVVKDDAIFDKYLEKPDDELEPRRPRDDEVDMLIDLEATREDHEETGNERDVTMQAGKRRGALPLIRKFIEHSERLLESAISTDGTGKRRRLDSGDASEPDLHNPEQSSGVLLEMQDRQRYFESRAGAAASAEQVPRPAVDLRAAWQQMRRDLDGWQGHLAQLKTDHKAAEAALAIRADAYLPDGRERVPAPAIYPPVGESTVGGPTTLAQKTANATRMAGYLTKMSERFGAIVRAAEMAGVDQSRRALECWETRKAAPGARRA